MRIFSIGDKKLVPFPDKELLQKIVGKHKVVEYKGKQKWFLLKYNMNSMIFTVVSLFQIFLLTLIGTSVGLYFGINYGIIQGNIVLIILTWLTITKTVFPRFLWYAVVLGFSLLFPANSFLLLGLLTAFNFQKIKSFENNWERSKEMVQMIKDGVLEEEYVKRLLQ